MGIPGEKSEQVIKSLFEEIMTKNFLNLVKKKTHFPGSEESQTSWILRRLLQHIITKMARFKEKERILKTTRESR